MSDQKSFTTIFLDDSNCRACVVFGGAMSKSFWKDGITERNISDLVDLLTGFGHHVTLYRVGSPSFFLT